MENNNIVVVERLIKQLKELTIVSKINSEQDIKMFVLGQVQRAFKMDNEYSLDQKLKLAELLSEAVISERFGHRDEKKETMKIYIARDRAVFEDEQQERFIHRHPEKENQYGRLRLFYEKPTFNGNTGKWEQARVATEIKNYMFPQIKCGECAVFEGLMEIPEEKHYPGAMHQLN